MAGYVAFLLMRGRFQVRTYGRFVNRPYRYSKNFLLIITFCVILSEARRKADCRVEVLEREANAKHLRSDPKPTSEARKGSTNGFGWPAVGKVTFPEESQPNSPVDPASGYALALLLVQGVPPLNPQKFDCGRRMRLPSLRMTHRGLVLLRRVRNISRESRQGWWPLTASFSRFR